MAREASFHTQRFLIPPRPFSVVPYSLWHGQTIASRPLGKLVRGGEPDPSALEWLGVPCNLCELQVRLSDILATSHTPLLGVVAKLPIAPSPSEKTAILGYNFIVDNSLRLTMQGIAGRMVSVLAVP